MDTILSDTEIQIVREAAENGSGNACYRLGEHYYALSRKEDALEWYKKAVECEAYNPCAYFNIGYAYQHGEGTAVDMTEACRWYQRGAEAGVPQALYNLAYFYQNGLVVHQDYDKAIYYATAAANEMSRRMTQFYEVQERYKKLDELDRQILDLEEALKQAQDKNIELQARAEAAEGDALVWRNTAETEGKKRWEEKTAYEEKIRCLEEQAAEADKEKDRADVPKMKFCIRCGREQKASNKFCIYCGRTW